MILARASVALVCLAAQASRAFADAPDLMQTVFAEDATLNNNLTPIEPRWAKSAHRRVLELGFSIEKMLSPKSSVEVGGQWDSMSVRGGRGAANFGNVGLAFKYVFLKRENFQLALVPQLSVPTGSHVLNEPQYVSTGGLLSWGGRLGTSAGPGWRGYLQGIELQGDLGYSHGFSGSGSDEVFFDPVVDYSMPLLEYSSGSHISWPLRNVCVFSELNFSQLLSGNDQTSPSLFITPGIAYLTEAYQVSIGIQMPLTRTANQDAEFALFGSIIIAMDRIYPRFGWTPF